MALSLAIGCGPDTAAVGDQQRPTAPDEPGEEMSSPSTDATSFFEDFDGDRLDRSRWGFEAPFYGSGDGVINLYDPAAVSVADGLLTIRAERLPDTIRPTSIDGAPDRLLSWSSGFVKGLEPIDIRYGRVEVRARAPRDAGMWAALWLRPRDRAYGPWPRSGEIDIVEILGRDPAMAKLSAHWHDAGHVRSVVDATVPATTDGFHVYSITWSPAAIVWEIDGIESARLSTWTSDVGPSPAPFDQPMYLNMNLAVGGPWAGPAAKHVDRAVLEIDWIRITPG